MIDRPLLPPLTSALLMHRMDRAKIRAAVGSMSDEAASPAATYSGLGLRVNPFMPEGMVAAVDRAGNLLAIIDLRGDHSHTITSIQEPVTEDSSE